MKMLTLIETEEIDEIVKNHLKNPEKREWQKLLAFKIVEIIHSPAEAELCKNISNFMFWEDENRIEVIKNLNDDKIKTFVENIWWFKYSGENLFETITKSWLTNSNSEAREAVKSGAIFINEEKILDFNFDVSKNFINDKILLLRKWKKNFKLAFK
jgi:tyrosyl-tRNA synthetase